MISAQKDGFLEGLELKRTAFSRFYALGLDTEQIVNRVLLSVL
jgi:hypothetical protein